MRIYLFLALTFLTIVILPWTFQAGMSAAIYALIFLIYNGARFFMYAIALVPAVYVLRRFTR